MPRTRSPWPPDLGAAARRLDVHRRRRAKRAIPTELWLLAAELAARHGVSPVSRALRLDYYEIKRRVEASRAPRAFVEIVASPAGAATECRVEFEDARGAKMRVAWTARGAPDLEALSRIFLGRPA